MASRILLVLTPTLDLLADMRDDAAVVLTLRRGDSVTLHEQSPGWFLVSYATPSGPIGGYAPSARVDVSLSGDCGEMREFNERVWELTTDAVARKVGYELGAHADRLSSNPPVIDCSGWIAYLLQTACRWINAVANETVFAAADLAAMQTYSDAMVRTIRDRTGFMLQDADVTEPALRSGMVIGVNEGPQNWTGTEARPLGISHVLLVIRNPVSDVKYVTQSTTDRLPQSEGSIISGPRGVCCVQLAAWLALARKGGLEPGQPAKPGLYAVDALRMADAFTQFVGRTT
jgi:hypothetical protein